MAAYEFPIAQSMVHIVRSQVAQTFEPFVQFLFLWMAFNNIYTTLSDKAGAERRLQTLPDGTTRTCTVHGIVMAAVNVPTEQERLGLAFKHFSDSLKDEMIQHESTRFFAYRTPQFQRREIHTDAQGQRLNGVLNIHRTLDPKHPVWAPIDTAVYEHYMAGECDRQSRDKLAKQILDLLYTVRNNTFHGGKRADDANDVQVLLHAAPLVQLIVSDFLR